MSLKRRWLLIVNTDNWHMHTRADFQPERWPEQSWTLSSWEILPPRGEMWVREAGRERSPGFPAHRRSLCPTPPSGQSKTGWFCCSSSGKDGNRKGQSCKYGEPTRQTCALIRLPCGYEWNPQGLNQMAVPHLPRARWACVWRRSGWGWQMCR